MKTIVANKELVACCGLYCGSCKKYLMEKCSGCRKNEKASWCKVRSCCIDNGYASCADCKLVSDAKDCKKFNNFISNVFRIIFKSDRGACVEMIKKTGYENFADEMAKEKLMTIKK